MRLNDFINDARQYVLQLFAARRRCAPWVAVEELRGFKVRPDLLGHANEGLDCLDVGLDFFLDDVGLADLVALGRPLQKLEAVGESLEHVCAVVDSWVLLVPNQKRQFAVVVQTVKELKGKPLLLDRVSVLIIFFGKEAFRTLSPTRFQNGLAFRCYHNQLVELVPAPFVIGHQVGHEV